MKTSIWFLLLLYGTPVLAQQPITIHIINDETNQAIPGVTVHISPTNRVLVADALGNISLSDLPKGRYTLQFTAVGFREKKVDLSIPQAAGILTISLDPEFETQQDVVVSSTRISQHLKNSPVAVQVIAREDIDEGTGQSPANIRELLTELSGTQVQTTSAVSGNTAIRLQGLDGRYTQLLKDGFPLYGGFSGSLSILQVPPLDLRQVEVIKGAGSALYGGDAIAGIINLISRSPDTMFHMDAILNQTNRGGRDFGTFFGRRGRRLGFTVMGTASRQKPTDVNNDGFTDFPKVRQVLIAPTFFWYPNDSTSVRLGINFSKEGRNGGDVQALLHGAGSIHPFLQENHTDRYYYQLAVSHKTAHQGTFSLKNSVGYFYRRIAETTGGADSAASPVSSGFSGTEISSFTEASYSIASEAHQIIAGANLVTDQFQSPAPHKNLSYTHTTAGLFAQDDWTINRKTVLEFGARGDLENTLYFLPRVALLVKPVKNLSVRIGGGLAYKLATVFNATDEEYAYQQVYPIAPSVEAERSVSANLSIAYHQRIGDDLYFTADDNLYYTRLNHALIPQADSLQRGWLYYFNAPGPVNSYGSETNFRFTQDDFTLRVSYTYTQTHRVYLPGGPQFPLAPRSRLTTSLVYEAEAKWKAGIEGFYTGEQILDNGETTRDFWTFDLMVQRNLGHFAILVNLENFTDTRQSRFGPIYSGTPRNPVFNEIYAPLEGRVLSVALRCSL